MRIGSLFSGAGGLDMAVEEVFGGRTVWHCELDEAASKVLAYRWPGVPNLGDITVIDWSTVEAIEVLCGGFPCQDVSPAGRRAGLKDGTRSGLWAMFADAIKALRPKAVVIENVRGLLSADGEEWPDEVTAAADELARLGRIVRLIESKTNRAIREGWWHGEYKRRKQFETARMARLRDRALARFRTIKRRLIQRAIGTVIADLANLGYDAQWTTVSAASVGAPHKRERVFILAHPAGQPWIVHDGDQLRAGWPEERPGATAGPGVDADAARDGRDEGRPESARLVGGSDVAERGHGPAADAEGERGADIARGGLASGQHVVTVSGSGDRDRQRRTASGVRQLGAATHELATVAIGCVCWEQSTAHSGHCCWRDEPSNGWPDDEPACGHRHLGDGGPHRDGLCSACTEAQRLGLSSWSCPDPNVCGEPTYLLPTPTASRSGNNQSPSPGAAVRPSLDSITDLLPTPRKSDGDGGSNPLSRAERMDDVETRVIRLLQTPSTADGGGGHLNRSGARSDEPLLPGQAREMHGQQWGKYAPAIHRWESVTRSAPSPTEPNTRGNPRLSATFPEWMMGWPAGWVTEVPGISRNDQLRIIGNGVCPQQATAALSWLLQIAEVAA